MRETDITIGGKKYHVRVAETEEEKTIGLSEDESLPQDEGMLFVYEEPQEELYFTMEDTSIDLDIIFIDDEGSVLSVNTCKAFDEKPVYEGGAQFVLEVNANSGIQEDDDLEYDDDEDESQLTSDEKQKVNSDMLVLDNNGDVQYRLVGGERIFSRKNTRSLIKAALRAFHSDDDADYKRVGRLVFKYLDKQDSNTPEYVSSPD